MELKLGMPVTVILASEKTSSWTPSLQWNDLVAVGVRLPPSIAQGGREQFVMAVLKRVLVCRYGMDCASALRGSGTRTLMAECDPFCALQAYREWPLTPSCLRSASWFLRRATSTASLVHMKRFKNNAFAGEHRTF